MLDHAPAQFDFGGKLALGNAHHCCSGRSLIARTFHVRANDSELLGKLARRCEATGFLAEMVLLPAPAPVTPTAPPVSMPTETVAPPAPDKQVTLATRGQFSGKRKGHARFS